MLRRIRYVLKGVLRHGGEKLISWNVNGIRACIGKGFSEAFAALDADILCLQETKVQAGQVDFAPEGYHCYWNYAEKRAIPARRSFRVKSL